MQENQIKKSIIDILNREVQKLDINIIKTGDKNILKKFTAGELALNLNVSRNLISHYLNQMFINKIVFKVNSRPVYFFPKKQFCALFNMESIAKEYNGLTELLDFMNIESKTSMSFSQVIGANESLSYCVEQCKAAIGYPGNGLPILLNGSTGTGKSMLANCLFDYAKETGIISKDARFFSMNCAEYANNPELLLTNLFGYKKGAYTGADCDHEGIIALANNGVLFLDEVHALQAESQEKIFLFMDKGIYHMVGDNDTWYKSNVRMIFATTEDPKACLLKTLLRRIPITVKLPSLKQRPLHEKKELIYYLLKREANKIHKKIRISKLSYQVMESAEYIGNVGELKNNIKAAVAKALLNHNKEDIVDIHIYDLPNELLDIQNKEISQISFDDKTMIDLDIVEDEKINTKMYQFNLSILNSFNNFPGIESNFISYVYSIHEKVEQYIDYLYYSDEEKDSPNDKILYNLLSNIFQIIATKYNLKMVSNNETEILSRLINDCLSHSISLNKLMYINHREIKQFIEYIKKYYPLDYNVAVDISALINDALHLRVGEMGLIDIFLFFHYFDRDLKSAAIPGIIIAHGYNIASSIAELVNQLLNQKVFDAIDMPIDSDLTLVISMLKEFLLQKKGCSEFIVMVDMGSLEDIYSYLENISNIDLGIINNVSTKLCLDIGSMILEGIPISDILSEASKRNQHRYKIINNYKKQNAIITVCETGIGTAEKIASLIEKSIPIDSDIKVMAYDFVSLSSVDMCLPILKKHNVIGIIGTKDPQIGIQFISIEELLEKKCIEPISQMLMNYIDDKQIALFNDNLIKYFSMENLLSYLTILDTNKIMNSVQEIIKKLQEGLKITFTNGVVMGLYVHISCLVERLIISKKSVYYEDEDVFKSEHQDFIELVKTIFNDIENSYNVEIPISEIAYIYDYIYYRPSKSVKEKENSVKELDFF